jgi:hypothetical protein
MVAVSKPIQSMAERYERPAWVRRLNLMGDAVGGAARLVPLDPADLAARASASVGETDFGDFGDAGWRQRFTTIVEDADAGDLHVVGRLLTRQELLRALRARLLMARAVRERPAIRTEKIEAPVIVTGPARSGTTILFELLSLDPALRAPLAFEALHPAGLPGATDRRLEVSECEQELWADVQPEFAAMHELRSDLPVECVTLNAPGFSGTHWPMVLPLPRYAPDLQADYAFHRSILQVLQHGAPPRTWLLKTPSHLATLGLLFATYPDAWVVQTHRDPVKTMPSTVSITSMVRWMRSDAVDLELMASVIGATFGAALLGVIEQRANGTVPDRFVDVHFQSLIRDPVETIRAAYAGMGREFGDEHAERIRRYLRDKPQGKFGTHRYTAEEWGFDAADLRRRLAPYVEHYGVALEE